MLLCWKQFRERRDIDTELGNWTQAPEGNRRGRDPETDKSKSGQMVVAAAEG